MAKKRRQSKSPGIVVGLTGQTGAGKSTVSEMLVDRGYRVIDADEVARFVVEKGKQCLLDLALEFGIEILDAEGNLRRRALGAMVFRDKKKRQRLNQITFPYIQAEIARRTEEFRLSGDLVIFLDAPTLFESGSEKFCDKVVSVVAPAPLRLRRLLMRDIDYSREELENRIAAQHEDDFYAKRSDFVIRNDSTMADLRFQLVEMLEYVCSGVQPAAPTGED